MEGGGQSMEVVNGKGWPMEGGWPKEGGGSWGKGDRKGVAERKQWRYSCPHNIPCSLRCGATENPGLN